jgi:hypothetical protein
MSRFIEAPPPMNWQWASRELLQVADLSQEGETGLDLYRTGQRGEKINSMIASATSFLQTVQRDLEVLERNDLMWSLQHGPRYYHLEEIHLLPQDSKQWKRLKTRVENSTQTIQHILAGDPVEPKDFRRCLRLVCELSARYTHKAIGACDFSKRLQLGLAPAT